MLIVIFTYKLCTHKYRTLICLVQLLNKHVYSPCPILSISIKSLISHNNLIRQVLLLSHFYGKLRHKKVILLTQVHIDSEFSFGRWSSGPKSDVLTLLFCLLLDLTPKAKFSSTISHPNFPFYFCHYEFMLLYHRIIIET